MATADAPSVVTEPSPAAAGDGPPNAPYEAPYEAPHEAPIEGPASPPALAGFAGFLQRLREPDLPPAVMSPRRFCEALTIDLQTLADLAHVHRNTVQRSPASPQLQAYLRDALRVIRAASARHADIESTLFWFRNEPLPGFDFQTPERVVSARGPDPLLLALRSQPPP